MLKSMAEEGEDNWASAVRGLLCTNDFDFALWNGSVGDETRFILFHSKLTFKAEI